jgi:hypothetical protein
LLPPTYPDSAVLQLNAYYGRVGGTGAAGGTTWTFPDPVLGFFGYIDGLISGDVLGITVGADKFEVKESGGFGVLGELDIDLFSDVVWESAMGQSVSFTIDNFSYPGTAPEPPGPGHPIPAPPAIWLFGAGLLGLIGFNRRSKAV